MLAAEAEALLVDDGWHAPEPEPVTAEPGAASADDLLQEAPERAPATSHMWAVRPVRRS